MAAAAGGMSFDPITGGVQAAAMVAQTVSQIVDTDKRRKYEFALSRLSSDQQLALNKKMASASSQENRLAILTSAIATIEAQTAAAKIQEGTKSEMLKAILIIGGGIALITVAYLIKKS